MTIIPKKNPKTPQAQSHPISNPSDCIPQMGDTICYWMGCGMCCQAWESKVPLPGFIIFTR